MGGRPPTGAKTVKPRTSRNESGRAGLGFFWGREAWLPGVLFLNLFHALYLVQVGLYEAQLVKRVDEEAY